MRIIKKGSKYKTSEEISQEFLFRDISAEI